MPYEHSSSEKELAAELEWIEREKAELLPLEKIQAVTLEDCGEPLVSVNKAGIHTYLFRGELSEKADKEVFLRETVVNDLLDINRELEPLGLELMVTHGWREPEVQKRQFDEAYATAKADHPDWSHDELYREAAIFSFPFDIAPHVTGGAVDVTLALKGSHTPIDMGCAVNRDSVKMWRETPFINQEQRKNRELLKDVFDRRGFFAYPGEYWHFSKGDRESAAYLRKEKAVYGPATRPKV